MGGGGVCEQVFENWALFRALQLADAHDINAGLDEERVRRLRSTIIQMVLPPLHPLYTPSTPPLHPLRHRLAYPAPAPSLPPL